MSISASLLFCFLLLLFAGAVGAGDAPISCRDKCGSIPVKYPLGTGPGCGHPAFSPYLRCTDDAVGAHGAPHALYLSTRSGDYAVTGVDYPSSTLTLADPLMSTCTAMQNSGGFAVDAASPFRLLPDDVFLLLGCSTSSPVFDPAAPLCDPAASRLCRGLYSCPAVAGLGLSPGVPASTCCVYAPPRGTAPLGLGVDLPKLQCASYACLRGLGDREGDPAKWKYGIALRFNDTYANDACDACEGSPGACGFGGADGSFVCVCRNGVNTTTNCYGQGYAWSGSWKQGGEKKIGVIGIFLLWTLLFWS